MIRSRKNTLAGHFPPERYPQDGDPCISHRTSAYLIYMRDILPASILIFILVFSGCSSPESTRESRTTANERDAAPDTMTRIDTVVVKAPPSIKPNASFVSAFVDTVIPIDDIHYTIRVQLTTAHQEGNFESLAEPGQRLELTPMLRNVGDDSLFWTDEQNLKFFQLRKTGYGDSFIGIISLRSNSGWVIERLEAVIFGEIR